MTEPAAPLVDAEPARPSWATGEFWITLAPLVVAVGTLLTGHAVNTGEVTRELAVVGTIVSGLYMLARTMLKAAHVHAAAKVAVAQLQNPRPVILNGGVTVTGGGGGGAGGSSGAVASFTPTPVPPRPPRKAARKRTS